MTVRVGYVRPDSALLRTADDLLGRHTGGPDGGCTSCGLPYPCPSARHAAEVRKAAGFGDGAGAPIAPASGPLGAPDPLGGPGAFGTTGNTGSFGERAGAGPAPSNQPTARRFTMDQRPVEDDEERHVPATSRDAAVPAGDDYDHTGHERKEDMMGGTRGGGNPDSTLGR